MSVSFIYLLNLFISGKLEVLTLQLTKAVESTSLPSVLKERGYTGLKIAIESALLILERLSVDFRIFFVSVFPVKRLLIFFPQ